MSSPEDSHGTGKDASDIDTADPGPKSNAKKRKRDIAQPDELEIDVSLPEPPSKKALRKAKKQKGSTANGIAPVDGPQQSPEDGTSFSEPSANNKNDVASSKPADSAYGIWIGNLPFNVTKPMLRSFFTSAANTPVPDDCITRVHMPAPTNTGPASKTRLKPQNKGFAYVDFSTPAALATAISLSETPLGGRRVLIKAAKDFAGRPEKTSATAAAVAGVAVADHKPDNAAGRSDGPRNNSKQPTRRVFVGNLGFDVTKEDLQKHYEVCGVVEDVFMATFEDTRKCKGFAWVAFEDIAAATSAVQGWAMVEGRSGTNGTDADGSGEEDDQAAETTDDKTAKKKKSKPRKWFVNRLQGRTLRCEFAEDASTRYKKRFGKDKENSVAAGKPQRPARGRYAAGTNGEESTYNRPESSFDEPKDKRGLGINPGAPTDATKRRGRTDKAKRVHDEATYRTGAIVEAKGQKITFD